MADAHQRDDVAVTKRLREQAVARIDQQYGKIGRRCGRRHVARVLLVAGGVRDDEAAARRGKIAIGDVDGYSLLALRLQPVDQQRQIGLARRCGAEAQRIRGERRPLILVDQPAIEQQPADQRRFAVVDRAAGEKAQQPAVRQAPTAPSTRVNAGWRRQRPASKISRLLLALHRRILIVIDDPAPPLAGLGGDGLADDLRQRLRAAFDRAGQRIAAERAKANPPRLRSALPAASGIRSSSTMIRQPSRSTTGRSLAK